MEAAEERLASWFASQLPDAQDVWVEGLDHVDSGHSAEMLSLTIRSRTGVEERTQDVVVKLRPPSPGLLEPYDLDRQVRILRALEGTPVLAPRVLWHEPTGEVLGRELYVMERIAGEAYERVVPPELEEDPGQIPRMCDSLADQLAEIHLVDLEVTGLRDLGDGGAFLERQLDHWVAEMRRVQKRPLPALEQLLAALQHQVPEPSERITLVHGDAKPGNFGFVGDQVSAVFDWEMTDVGDPMADIGYLELNWGFPVGINSRPSAPPIEEVLARYQERTGMDLRHREWHRAMQAFKTAVILLVGSMLYEDGHSDDPRFRDMGYGIDFITQAGLRSLG